VALYALNQEFDRVAERLLERALRPAPGAPEAVLRTLLAHGIEPGTIYDRVVCPALRRMARGWDDASLSLIRIQVALSEIEEALSRTQVRLVSGPRTSRRAVVAAISPDQHLLPLRLASNLLESEGWSVASARGPSPALALADYLRSERPDLLCLSATVAPDPEAFLQEASLTSDAAREAGAAVFIGGQALGELRGPLPADRVLDTFSSLVDAVREL
jgi:hypothetical protein